MSNYGAWQWNLSIVVYHDASFGHAIKAEQVWNGRQECKEHFLGSWKGLGVPESVLNQARAMIDSIFTEHLVSRYGVQGELPTKWSGDPDPF